MQSGAQFPLTLTLSPEEREQLSFAWEYSWNDEGESRGVVFSAVESAHKDGSHRAGPHAVGFGIADKLSLAQIELQVSL